MVNIFVILLFLLIIIGGIIFLFNNKELNTRQDRTVGKGIVQIPPYSRDLPMNVISYMGGGKLLLPTKGGASSGGHST
tara:strand:- start:926 stop:1159 length:234 start_codon:yes stop_codon:yes gene_type:complete